MTLNRPVLVCFMCSWQFLTRELGMALEAQRGRFIISISRSKKTMLNTSILEVGLETLCYLPSLRENPPAPRAILYWWRKSFRFWSLIFHVHFLLNWKNENVVFVTWVKLVPVVKSHTLPCHFHIFKTHLKLGDLYILFWTVNSFFGRNVNFIYIHSRITKPIYNGEQILF